MTEQKAIKVLQNNFPKTCKMVDGRYKGGFDDSDCDFGKALLLAISSLEEIQQYREVGKPEELKQLKENGAFTGMELAQIAIMQMELKKYMAIGTVEECRAALEKQRAKKPAAYDVDKVVGRLEEKISEIKDQLMYTHDEDMAVRLRCKMHGLDEALEIVKAVE